MFNFLTSLLSGPPRPYPSLPRPQRPVCLIGDLHGRADLLERMLVQIGAQDGAETARLVVLGDMIDRGPEAARVLAQLRELQEDAPGDVICLMGNHERMMLDFLDDPAGAGTRWLSFGGAETLSSFGVSPWTGGTGRDGRARLEAQADALRRAMPSGVEDWLRTLPLFWQEDRLAAVHAGANPDLPLQDQPEDVLLWGHRAHLRRTRSDGLWVAHGHTIVESPHAVDGRIAVDTGAWRTGRLSAAWLDPIGLRFLQAT